MRVRVKPNRVGVRQADALQGPAGVMYPYLHISRLDISIYPYVPRLDISISPYLQACDLLAALLDDDPEGGSSEEEGGINTGR